MQELLSENGLVPAEDAYYLLAGSDKIKLVDATYSMPDGQSPEQGFLGRRIEGAQFFDIDVIADQKAPLPHTLPSPDYFAACVEALGISNDDHVLVYDQSGAYMASSRAWWMFRVFGHRKVYVLEGGLQAWSYAGFKVVNGPAEAPKPGRFKPAFQAHLVVNRKALLENIDTRSISVLDARPAARFDGRSPEPRPGMRPGHIPGSKNLPHTDVLDRATGFFKNDKDLENLFDARGITAASATAVSCGSGVTACTLALALYKSRRQDAAVYDGSWSEWGDSSSETPVEISA